MCSSSSSLWPSSHEKLQHTVALAIKRSSGLRERIHWGKKSQVWSLVGRWPGLQACITFTMAMKMFTPRKGAPTPAITRQPANERPSTSEGRSKKQRRRYKTANQRYLAVRSPRTRAILIGRRMKGRGYHSRMPKMLKKRWHNAIYVQREDRRYRARFTKEIASRNVSCGFHWVRDHNLCVFSAWFTKAVAHFAVISRTGPHSSLQMHSERWEFYDITKLRKEIITWWYWLWNIYFGQLNLIKTFTITQNIRARVSVLCCREQEIYVAYMSWADSMFLVVINR